MCGAVGKCGPSRTCPGKFCASRDIAVIVVGISGFGSSVASAIVDLVFFADGIEQIMEQAIIVGYAIRRF